MCNQHIGSRMIAKASSPPDIARSASVGYWTNRRPATSLLERLLSISTFLSSSVACTLLPCNRFAADDGVQNFEQTLFVCTADAPLQSSADATILLAVGIANLPIIKLNNTYTFNLKQNCNKMKHTYGQRINHLIYYRALLNAVWYIISLLQVTSL
jgi:hypothetical protein